jgi:hypothetical protein
VGAAENLGFYALISKNFGLANSPPLVLERRLSGIAGGSSHTATAGMAIHGAGGDVIAKLAGLAWLTNARRCSTPAMPAFWRRAGASTAATTEAAARAMPRS